MPATQGLHVLLVEDNPEERWLFTELLRSRGHTVTACEDAETAWEAFKENRPSLILLDWILPGMDGLELCRRIRQEGQASHCNIVVVTSKGTAQDLREVLDAGADDYIAKPVDVSLMEIRLAVAEERVRKASEAEATRADLETKTQELEALFLNLDEVFFSIDPATKRLIQISPAVVKVVGVDAQTLVEDTDLWREYLCPPEMKDKADCLDEISSDEPLETEYQVVTPEGEPRWVRCTLKPGLSSSGTVLRVDGLLSDITRRKVVEEELSARNQELASLFRVSEIARSGPDPDRAVQEILEIVTEATGFPIALLERFEPDRDRDYLLFRGIRGFCDRG